MDLQRLLARQDLIEEIFSELEELILNANDSDYLTQTSILLSPRRVNKKSPATTPVKGPNDYLPRTAQEWNALSQEDRVKFRSQLLEILEQKKLQLSRSIEHLNKTFRENVC